MFVRVGRSFTVTLNLVEIHFCPLNRIVSAVGAEMT
jgi:hypothetical protein